MSNQSFWKRIFDHPYPAAESLFEIGKMFHLAYEQAPIGMAFVGADFRLLEVNVAFRRLFGYTKEELKSRTFVDLIHPEDVAQGKELIRRLARCEMSGFKLENRYLTGSGETLCGIVSVTLVRDSDGASLYGLVMIEDITERKREGAALRESEACYRDLVENSGVMIGTHDLAGFILSINQSFVRFAGYERDEELIGRQLSDLLAPDTRHLFPAYLEKISSEGHAQGLMRIVTPGGEERILAYDNSVRWVGLPTPSVRCFGTDVTERKRIESALRESEARLRSLGDNLHNGVIFQLIQEPDGRTHPTYISASIEEMAGVPAREAMLDFRLLTEMILEEDRRRLWAAWKESMKSLSVFDLECRFRTRKGEVKWGHYRLAPRRLPNGRTLWDGIQVDITDTRRDLESLLQTVGAIVWEGEEDLAARTFRHTFVSQQAERLLGYPIKDWLGRSTLWLDYLHPEDRPRVLAERRQAIAAKGDFELEYRRLAKDSRIVWLREIVKVIAGNDQRLKLRGITIDITEQKKAEAALRESEEQLKLALSAAHMGTWDWQLPTNELKWSDQMQQIFDLADGKSDVTTDLFLHLIHPNDRPLVKQAITQAVKQGTPYDVEFRILHQDGSVHWVMGKGKALLDEAGVAVRMLGINMDITERKHAEDALRRSEARYRAIVEDQTELICRLLPDGRLTFVNESYARYFGRTSEELVGASFLSFIPADEEEHINQFMASFSPSDPVATIEHRVVLPGGEVRWQQWTYRAIHDELGRLLEFQCVGRDITRQRQMEQALRRSQRRYTMATVAGRVGLWDWNIETNDVYVDPELKAVLGYRDDEIRNNVDDWRSRVHPEDQEFIMLSVRDYVEGRTSSYEVEYRMMRKDDAVRWFLSRGTMVEDENGDRHIIGTTTDITERKHAEDALRRSEEALRHSHSRIEDLAGRLIIAQEEERKYIARELHDDLNQQVAALAIGIDRLKHHLPAADQSVLEKIDRLWEKADWLSKRIRRLSHELHSSTLQHVGLSAALKSYVAEFTEQAGTAVTLEIQDGLEAIPAAAALCMYRAVQELLRNIAKHSGAPSAEVKLASERGTLELCVTDRGVGFDPMEAESRLGLGLVSIEERVKLLGGNFKLKTRSGAGTEVKLQIPY
ncbi:MAG: PAS domain-containing protein [Acidobacteria bacterium]|nr:PAS domain-containing protein [Acidobacteriota bacterium]